MNCVIVPLNCAIVTATGAIVPATGAIVSVTGALVTAKGGFICNSRAEKEIYRLTRNGLSREVPVLKYISKPALIKTNDFYL